MTWQKPGVRVAYHLTEKVTAVASLTSVQVVVDHAMPILYTAKINKVKDLALIF